LRRRNLFLFILFFILIFSGCNKKDKPEGSISGWKIPEAGIFYSTAEDSLFYNYESGSWGTSRFIAVKYDPEAQNKMIVFFDMDRDGSFSKNEIFACNVEKISRKKGEYLKSDFDSESAFLFYYNTVNSKYQLIYEKDKQKKWLQILIQDNSLENN